MGRSAARCTVAALSRDLTIASVVFGDRPQLEVAADLADALNPGHAATWRMIANLPFQPADRAGEPGRFEVVPGAELTAEERAQARLYASLHHAKGLNAGLRDIRTRYLLILDPDCLIVRPGWMDDVLAHMAARGLAFFGVPYHPRGLTKLRYFPCCVCLFIDCARVPVAELDWTPAPPERAPAAGAWADRQMERLLRRWDSPLRARVQRSRDTGFRVYQRYRDDPAAPGEAVTPVVEPRDLRGITDAREVVLEHLLPDRWCLAPRRAGGLTDRTFASLGAPDLAGRGAEEYLWRGEPFAVHLRGADEQIRRDLAAQQALLGAFRG